MNAPSTHTHWWIAPAGQAEGPRTTQSVIEARTTGTLPENTLACPVGGKEWKPLSAWPELGAPPVLHDQRNEIAPGIVYSSPLTNPKLPAFANWICVYAMAVSPALWILGTFLGCLEPSGFQGESRLFLPGLLVNAFFRLISLAQTTILAWGGYRLRGIRRSGRTILIAGIWSVFVSGVVQIAIYGVLALTASPTDFAESTTAQTIVTVFWAFLGSFEMVFLVIALVWLHRTAKFLPFSGE